MKKIALAAAMSALFGVSAAQASDDLTGFYVGGSIGLATATTTIEDADYWYNGGAYTVKPESLSYGIQGGQNLASGNLLFGWSADYVVGDMDDNFDYGYYGGPNDEMRAQSEVKSLLSLRGKAGLMVGKTALVASFGLAQAEFDSRLIDRDPNPANWYTAKYDDTASGIVYGLGLEHAVSDKLTVAADLSKYSFDTESANFKDVNGVNQNYKVNFVHSVENFRISANYKF